MYGKENPEWNTEKYRYYVELPGDAWADGSLMALVKQNMVAHAGCLWPHSLHGLPVQAQRVPPRAHSPGPQRYRRC